MNHYKAAMTLFAAAGALLITTTAMADQHLEAPDRVGQPTISPAIDAAQDGDTLYLAPGEYIERIEATDADDCKTLHFIGTGKDPADTVIRASRFRHRFGGFDLCPDRSMNYTFENLTFASQDSGEQTMDGLGFSSCTVRFVNCRFIGLQSLYLDNVDRVPEFEHFGAISLDRCTASFEECELYDNGVAFNRLTDELCRAEGGAIHAYDSTITINNSNLEANYAVACGHATDRATSTSGAIGGAIYAVKGSLNITNTRFHENEAAGYASQKQPDEILGGAIYAVNLEQFKVTDCDFEHNSAQWGRGAFDGPRGYAGAIYVGYWETYPFNGPGATHLADNRFYRNTTDFDGGAVYVGEDAQVKIKRCEFECNTLEQAAGPWRDAGGNEFIEDCDPPCPGDLNADGVVDKFDLFVIYSLWGKVKTYEQYPADLNYDGVVDNKDVLVWTRLAADCKQDEPKPFGK